MYQYIAHLKMNSRSYIVLLPQDKTKFQKEQDLNFDFNPMIKSHSATEFSDLYKPQFSLPIKIP